MQFVDNAPLTGTRITSDGYLVAEVRVARTGIQQYLARELGLNQDGIVNVYRPEETVFSKDSLSTFAGKPVTMLHPPEPVTSSNWRQYAVGDIGEEIMRDGEFVRVPIKLMDADAIAAVTSGKRELSVGYSVAIEMRDGVSPDGTPYQAVQTGHLKVNHLAIVPKARGGDKLRIGDGVENWGIAPISTNDTERKPDVSNQNLRTVVVGDEAVEVTDAGARVIEKMKLDIKELGTRLSDAEARTSEIADAKDAEIGQLKAELQAARDAAPTQEQTSKLVADRVALETEARRVFSDVQTAGVSDADIRRAVVAHKLGADIVDGASDAEVSGMFKAVSKDTKNVDGFRKALMQRDMSAQTTADNGQSKYERRLADAWKNVEAGA